MFQSLQEVWSEYAFGVTLIAVMSTYVLYEVNRSAFMPSVRGVVTGIRAIKTTLNERVSIGNVIKMPLIYWRAVRASDSQWIGMGLASTPALLALACLPLAS